MTDDTFGRREFLSAVGATTLSGLVGVGSARRGRERDDGTLEGRPPGSAGPDADGSLPVYASGKSIHRYRRDGDAYVHHHRFVSDDLARRYGDPVVEFEPERIPPRMLPEDVRERQTAVYQFEDRQVVGTPAEHRISERRVRSQRAERIRAQTHLTDDVPLYHYRNSTDASNTQSRAAPINVGWEDAGSATWVKNVLEGDCGWTQYDWVPEQPRYVNDDGTVRSTDEHVMDRIYFTRQWHVRLYEVSDGTYDVVGQAHRDPLNHNQLVTIDDWHFDAAKERIVDCWTSHSSRTPFSALLENGSQWGSHDGRAALLEE